MKVDMVKSNTVDKPFARRVSVIIPAYDAANFLELALDSVLAQTITDIEVIVVDDASNDATLEVAYRVAARDPRVRVLHNERNCGPAVSRNRAMDAARGEWIALLDADDTWSPERLEKMLSVVNDADVVSDDVQMYIVNGSLSALGKPKSWRFLSQKGLAVTRPRELSILEFARLDLGLLKPILRRSFLQRHRLRYNPDLKHGDDDFHLYFEMLASGARWLQLPSAYYFYRWYSGSISRNSLENAQDVIKSNEILLDHPAVTTNKALAAVIENRLQEWQTYLAYHTILGLLRQRRFVNLARLLFEHPSYYSLFGKNIIKGLKRRVIWQIRKERAGKDL